MERSRILVCFFMLASMANAASEAPVTFIFGDSLAEVGNNNYLQSLAKANYPWYGIDYEGGQATGRFTNGRTIADIISAKLGIPSPPPYLSLSMTSDKILQGINYASGGAGILNDTGVYFIQRLSFDDQISYFDKTKKVIKAKIGEEAANKLCNRAIFLIGLDEGILPSTCDMFINTYGSNDYVNNFLQPFMADGMQYTHDDFVDLLMTTLDLQLRRLYQLGARKIVFNGVGPLGCIPSQRVKSKGGKCLKRVNKWVLEFNGRVQRLLSSQNSQLPGARFTFADTYPAVLDLINNPTTYGFKISNTSCCNVDTSIGGLCLPNSKLCNNRKDYVFWDAFHPSDAANAVLANKMFSSLFSNAPSPAPSPI